MEQEALEYEADTIVAAGGDGSVNETAAALVALDAPAKTAFAVVPLGTANDFATGLDIPQDPRDALLLATTDTACPIDIGICNNEVAPQCTPAACTEIGEVKTCEIQGGVE